MAEGTAKHIVVAAVIFTAVLVATVPLSLAAFLVTHADWLFLFPQEAFPLGVRSIATGNVVDISPFLVLCGWLAVSGLFGFSARRLSRGWTVALALLTVLACVYAFNFAVQSLGYAIVYDGP